MMDQEPEQFGFERYYDLVAKRLGGEVVALNDEFFAPAENLLKPGPPVSDPDRYTDRGKWMDGWETRRRREPGHDWCVVRFGAPGEPRGVVIDTTHFRGNHPARASLEACVLETDSLEDADWASILSEVDLEPDTLNPFAIDATERYTHVRLNIYPDGGVARLRVHGLVRPDWQRVSGEIDLVATHHGGRAVDCSDAFFSQPGNLLLPGKSTGMFDGWETRRRRGPGHDWVVVRLGRRGAISTVQVDTDHFKGNYPAACSVEVLDVETEAGELTVPDGEWAELVPRTELQADSEHRFEPLETAPHVATHLRLNIYPDGGVARFRVFGKLAEPGVS
jgi:allantoicase